MSRLVTAILGAWLYAWQRWGDRWGWLGIANALAEWLTWLVAVLALWHAWRGRWLQSGAAALLWLSGHSHRNTLYTLPPVNAATYRGSTLKILSGNMYKLSPSADEHIRIARQQQPDVLCLQELQHERAAEISAALGEVYPYSALRPAPEANGFGVWSRYPIRETAWWDEPGLLPWVQRVQIELPDGPIELYNVHLVPPTAKSTFQMGMSRSFRVREMQVRIMQQEMAARGLPAATIGDHNFSATSTAYHLACQRLTDAWRVAGQGLPWTWPTQGFPLALLAWTPRLLRLDFCFHNEGFRAREAQAIRTRRSDHCALIVTLQRE